MNYNLVKQFKKQFRHLEEKYTEKDFIYVAIDIHETILFPTHSTELSKDFYPYALDTLKLITSHPRIRTILWTSSLDEITEQYHKFFVEQGINFNFINGNPEIASPFYANFDKKFFVNVIIDDKSGFNAEADWEPLHDYFLLLKLQDRITYEQCS